MRVRATRRVQAGTVSLEWDCDIECTVVEFIQPQVESIIESTLFRDVDTMAGDVLTSGSASNRGVDAHS